MHWATIMTSTGVLAIVIAPYCHKAAASSADAPVSRGEAFQDA
jgi:hypothetical protein